MMTATQNKAIIVKKSIFYFWQICVILEYLSKSRLSFDCIIEYSFFSQGSLCFFRQHFYVLKSDFLSVCLESELNITKLIFDFF